MKDIFDSPSGLMARFTISALDRASKDPSCWKQPVVHRALLVSGLSLLVASAQLLKKELDLVE